MFLTKAETKEGNKISNDSCYIQQLRKADNVLSPDRIRTGGYYIYKEKYGIVALVKVLDDISEEGWTGYRIMVKRVLYSPWQVPKNAVFEIGFSTETMSCPPSWHFEPGITLVSNGHVA